MKTRENIAMDTLFCTTGEQNKRLHSLIDVIDKQEEHVRDFLSPILPEGSGIDCKWSIAIQYKRTGKYKVKPTAIVLDNFIHAMNDNGYYDGYIPFTVRIPFKDGIAQMDDFQLIAHNWKSYTTKKYWPLYVDYIAQTIEFVLSPRKIVMKKELKV